MRLNALGQKAGRKTIAHGSQVVWQEDGKWIRGHIYGDKLEWSGRGFETWLQAIDDKNQNILNGSFFGGFGVGAYIRDADGLYYTAAEMEGAYNWIAA